MRKDTKGVNKPCAEFNTCCQFQKICGEVMDRCQRMRRNMIYQHRFVADHKLFTQN